MEEAGHDQKSMGSSLLSYKAITNGEHADRISDKRTRTNLVEDGL